ncbi:MAG TPA: thermonuclease family protein [Steroidobacteraceae bacterium]|nr:thermonuclease family protein [Steroidobacteraceae bacterium]
MRRRTRVRPGSTALGVVALLLAGSAAAADMPKPMPLVVGTVSRVNDGDSIEVELDSGHARVRFSAIDTPEWDQPYGAQSSAALKSMLPIGSKVELEVVSQDAFHRLVATVWRVDGENRTNVNEAMLLQGHAWALRRYMKDPKFCDMEQMARSKKLGLWALPVKDWIYPPEWRYLKNGEIRTLPVPYEETREKCIEVLNLAGAATYTPPN